jgi:hypothetical protein
VTGYVTRAGWGARAPTSTTPIGSTRGVAIHWEGSRVGSFPHSECAAHLRSIQAYHMDANGWNDIAYNLIACPHDVVFEGRGAGKKSAANGSSQTNDDWYAVCALVGEGDPQPAALTTAVQYGADLCRSWGAGPDVCGHRDLFNTACPGNTLYGQVQAGVFDPGGDMPLTDDDLDRIARAVWAMMTTSGVDGSSQSMGTLLRWTYQEAHNGPGNVWDYPTTGTDGEKRDTLTLLRYAQGDAHAAAANTAPEDDTRIKLQSGDALPPPD